MAFPTWSRLGHYWGDWRGLDFAIGAIAP